MKKLFALAAAACCILMFSVSAEDVRYAFGIEGGVAVNAAEACITVFAAENRGIAGGALNIEYDFTAVRFLRCEPCEEFGIDSVSAYDNEYGQVRVAFVSSAGIMRSKGDMFRLYFEPLSAGASFAAAINTETSELFDDDYTKTSFSASGGTLEFTESDFVALPGSGVVVDYYSFTVRGIAAGTDRDTLAEKLGGTFILPENICTGAILMNGETEYTLIVKGDLDNDGRADTDDYIMLCLAVMGEKFGPLAETAADMDLDGVLTDADAALMKAFLLGAD